MNELKGKPTNQNHSPNPSNELPEINLCGSLIHVSNNCIQYGLCNCSTDNVYTVSLGF